MAAVVGPHKVDADGAGPIVGVVVPGLAHWANVAGVVDENVQVSEMPDGVSNGSGDLGAVCNIGDDGYDLGSMPAGDEGGGLLELGGSAGGEAEPGTLGGIGHRDGLTDAATAPGDEGDTPLQSPLLGHPTTPCNVPGPTAGW